MMIVVSGDYRKEIIGTVICCIVYDRCTHLYARKLSIIKFACWFRFIFRYCVFV